LDYPGVPEGAAVVANIDSAFPSKYLKAADLNGRNVVVTIDHVNIEPVGRDKEIKPVVYFAGKDKGLVLNKTNSSKIKQLAGTAETDDWAGVKITIYPTETEYQGETVDTIRVKAAGTEQPKPAPVVEMTDSDVPFAWVMPFVLPALASLSLLA
jgi:hypothetical protein